MRGRISGRSTEQCYGVNISHIFIEDIYIYIYIYIYLVVKFIVDVNVGDLCEA